MSTPKVILLSMFSAIVGAAAVLSIVQWKPNLFLIQNSDKTTQVKESTLNEKRQEQFLGNLAEQQKKMRKNFDSFFDDDFFIQENPFESMRKFRKQMEDQMNGIRGGSGPFDSWFDNRFGGGSIEDINKREDAKYVYYEINVPNIKETTIETKVKDGYITIKGQVKNKLTSENDKGFMGKSFSSSSFNRTFPLPQNVDPNKMENSLDGNTVVLKFPKVTN